MGCKLQQFPTLPVCLRLSSLSLSLSLSSLSLSLSFSLSLPLSFLSLSLSLSLFSCVCLSLSIFAFLLLLPVFSSHSLLYLSLSFFFLSLSLYFPVCVSLFLSLPSFSYCQYLPPIHYTSQRCLSAGPPLITWDVDYSGLQLFQCVLDWLISAAPTTSPSDTLVQQAKDVIDLVEQMLQSDWSVSEYLQPITNCILPLISRYLTRRWFLDQ